MTLDQNLKNQIISKLREKGAILPCQRCGKSEFTIMDGYFNAPINAELQNNLIVGGPVIPTVIITCNNCGCLNYHAVGLLNLGLLPKQNS
jgi:ribosomal protein L37E